MYFTSYFFFASCWWRYSLLMSWDSKDTGLSTCMQSCTVQLEYHSMTHRQAECTVKEKCGKGKYSK